MASSRRSFTSERRGRLSSVGRGDGPRRKSHADGTTKKEPAAVTELDRQVDCIAMSLRHMKRSGGYVKMMVHRFMEATKMLQRFVRRCVRERLVFVSSAMETVQAEEAAMGDDQVTAMWHAVPTGLPRREAKSMALNLMYCEQREKFRQDWKRWFEQMTGVTEQLKFELSKQGGDGMHAGGDVSGVGGVGPRQSKYDVITPLKTKLLKLKSRRPRFVFEVSAAALVRCCETQTKKLLLESVVETMQRLDIETTDPHVFQQLFARYQHNEERRANTGRTDPTAPSTPHSNGGDDADSDAISAGGSARDAALSRQSDSALTTLLQRVAKHGDAFGPRPPGSAPPRTARPSSAATKRAAAAYSSSLLAPAQAPAADVPLPDVSILDIDVQDPPGRRRRSSVFYSPARAPEGSVSPYPWSGGGGGDVPAPQTRSKVFTRKMTEKKGLPVTAFGPPPASPRLGKDAPKRRHFHDRAYTSRGSWKARWRRAPSPSSPPPPPKLHGEDDETSVLASLPASPRRSSMRKVRPDVEGRLATRLREWYGGDGGDEIVYPTHGNAVSVGRGTFPQPTAQKRVHRRDDLYYRGGYTKRLTRKKKAAAAVAAAEKAAARTERTGSITTTFRGRIHSLRFLKRASVAAAGEDLFREEPKEKAELTLEGFFKEIADEAKAAGFSVPEHDFWGMVDRLVYREQRRNMFLRTHLASLAKAEDEEAAARIEQQSRRTRQILARIRREQANPRPPTLADLVKLNNTHTTRKEYNAAAGYSCNFPEPRMTLPTPMTSLACRGPMLKTPNNTTYHYHRFFAPRTKKDDEDGGDTSGSEGSGGSLEISVVD